MIKVVIRRDHFRGAEFTNVLVINVDELRAVRDCDIQNFRFFRNGAWKSATAIDAAAGGDDGNRETIPAGVFGLLGFFQMVEANLNVICPEDILGK